MIAAPMIWGVKSRAFTVALEEGLLGALREALGRDAVTLVKAG